MSIKRLKKMPPSQTNNTLASVYGWKCLCGIQVEASTVKKGVEKGTATHSSTCAWRIPWTEEPGRLQSTGLQRVWQDLRAKPQRRSRAIWERQAYTHVVDSMTMVLTLDLETALHPWGLDCSTLWPWFFTSITGQGTWEEAPRLCST